MTRVRTGLERWLAGEVEPVPRGCRAGLLAHAASVDASSRHVLEHLRDGGPARLERLFAAEHGLWGHEQDMESVDAATDGFTGVPVVSLYGNSADSLRPGAGDLVGLDAIFYDLQDIGTRYYTFVYTLSYVMEAARDAGIPVVVLDRPNPLGGQRLEGPLLDRALSSFVGRYPLPVRHGMTAGELARMFNVAFDIGCDLHVVELRGWRREMGYDATGLPWVPPSPNMPTLATARVYPGGCLVEGTNLSEGRGTTTPFELVGAPWLDGHRLARRMREAGLPGVDFRPASFRPMFHKHAGQACSGVQVIVSDPQSFEPFATYLVLLREARRLASEFAWRTEVYEFEADRLAIDLLLGRRELRPLLESGATLEAMQESWRDDLAAFANERRAHLLYD